MVCDILRVLVWKHCMVRKRRFIHSTIEFISPAILFILWFSIWNHVFPPTSSPYSESEVILEPQSIDSANGLARVFYTPSNERTDALMEIVAKSLRLTYFKKDTLKPSLSSSLHGVWSYTNETELLPYFNQSSAISHNSAGVIFEDFDSPTLPKKLNYTIRMKRNFQTESYKTTPGYHEHFGEMYEDFVALQWAIDIAYIEMQSGVSVPQSLSVQHFPKPFLMKEDPTGIFIGNVLMTCSYLSPFTFFLFHVSRVIQERNSGIQELMQMIGVTRNSLALAHVVNSVPAWLVYTVIGGVLSGIKLPVSMFLPVLLILFLFFAYVIVLGFVCSMILKRPNHAVSISFTIYLLCDLIGSLATAYVPNKYRLLLLLSGLIPFVPLNWFWMDVGTAIKYGQPLNWMGIANPNDKYGGTVGLSLVMQLVQLALLALFAEYLGLVRPGKYGVARKWNFIFQWSKKVKPDTEVLFEDEDQHYGKYFEPPPTNTRVGIAVKNVSKIFGGWYEPKKVVLQNVNLNMYAGEITVLLGHNGAGKTTLMSIITGMYSPTLGKVYIKGHEVSSQHSQARKNFGLCPQHNLAFEDLTVREHLIFFAMLKGATRKEAISDCDSLLDRLRLTEKANNMSGQLSGGMKRRLQLGCALAGGSDVLVLDEPTSGLDVETRRELWNLLLSLRGERTVLLTTHFMEEADALGDRIAALHGGQIRCHATPMYLKRAMGTGYRLSLTLNPQHSKSAVMDVVASVVQNAQVKEGTATGMSIALPADDTSKFPALFNKLEEQKQRLDIRTMGVGVTTLEEVFLKLCSDEPFEDDAMYKGANGVSAPHTGPSFKRLYGLPLWLQQFRALLVRQIKYLRSRNVAFILWEIIIPVVVILLVAHNMNGKDSDESPNPQLDMNLKLYRDFGEPTVLHNIRLDTGNKLLEPFKKEYTDFKFQDSSNVIDEILHEGNTSISQYNRILGAIQLNDTHANALYTTTVRHSMPVSVNLLTNMLAARYLGATDPQTITTANHPVESTYALHSILRDFVSPKSTYRCQMWAILVACLCMALLVPMVTIAVSERLSESRHINIMTGVPYSVYFGAMCLFHIMLFITIALPTVVVAAVALDTENTFSNGSFVGALCLMVTLFAFAFTSFMYFVSYFTNEAGAATALNLMVVVFGFIMPVVKISTVDIIGTFGKTIINMSMAFPQYTFSVGFLKMAKTAELNAWCSLNKAKCPHNIMLILGVDEDFPLDCCSSQSLTGPLSYVNFSKYGIGPEVIAMVIQTCVFWVLVYMIESGAFNHWWDKCLNSKYQPPQRHYRDHAVLDEKEYVQHKLKSETPEATLHDDVALLDGLHKNYKTCTFKSHLAVKNLSFSVKKGECFGLLGVNGAGKSTTFKMVTGSEHPTRGRIVANGYDIANNKKLFMSTVMYCPQFGGLDDFLCGWDNVALKAQLRGVPPNWLHTEVSEWIDCVDLSEMKEQRVGQYSGGCTRRCATAAALVGSVDCGRGTSLAVLDEPTSGVDPAARRRVWTALRRSLSHGLSVVISSHSMDETEVLCDRIGIMSRGELGALGSAAALRASHARGFSAQLKLRASPSSPSFDSPDGAVLGTPMRRTDNRTKEEISKLKQILQSNFTCALKDEHTTMLDYHIDDEIRYSELFERMESIKHQFPRLLEDYTISETTLEEVFLSFAKDASSEP